MIMIENDINKKEKALLISIDCGEYDTEASVSELSELAKTAGAEVDGVIIQKRPSPEASTYVGSGRLDEICEFCKNNEIDLIVADGELSPVQIRNIENATNVRVIDRTTLILDIFASRARSAEGKIQVELAQLKYSLPRLTGKGTSLSRLGGGIGTRGPGETKLESDKRHIRRKIQNLNEELDKIEKRRNSMHARRKKNGVVTVAVVGYTNAGKSTLMNALTNAGVLAEDMLFATLDPTARKLSLPDGRSVMLVDTVGLVRRLPHHLVSAFRSTLEEAVQADLILNVCDYSSEDYEEHLQVTRELLSSLGCASTPVINVLNKCDLVDISNMPIPDKNSVLISAKNRTGFDELLEKICSELPETMRRVRLVIPFSEAGLASKIRKHSNIICEEYSEIGIKIEANVEIAILDSLKDYIV